MQPQRTDSVQVLMQCDSKEPYTFSPPFPPPVHTGRKTEAFIPPTFPHNSPNPNRNSRPMLICNSLTFVINIKNLKKKFTHLCMTEHLPSSRLLPKRQGLRPRARNYITVSHVCGTDSTTVIKSCCYFWYWHHYLIYWISITYWSFRLYQPI